MSKYNDELKKVAEELAISEHNRRYSNITWEKSIDIYKEERVRYYTPLAALVLKHKCEAYEKGYKGKTTQGTCNNQLTALGWLEN